MNQYGPKISNFAFFCLIPSYFQQSFLVTVGRAVTIFFATLQMRIRSNLDNKVQQELSADSLQHLQLAVNLTANGILYNMYKMKTKVVSIF